MIYLQLSGIVKTYDDNQLLRGIDLTVQRGERVGLVGANGTGKTTILKIVKGEVLPDAGVLTTPKVIKTGYVSQEDELSSEYSLFLAMIESFSELLHLKSEMENLESRIAHGAEDDLEEYGELQLRWEHLGGYTLDADVKNALGGLGFDSQDLWRPVSSFSGGERNRGALARELLHSPDLLLLDEPTNHLDIESTVWLEQYLTSYDGAAIIVSHDRIFLDQVVTKIVELDNGKLELYHGNFSRFWQEREQRRQLKLKQYLEQKEEVERIEDFIRRNIAGQKSKQAQSRRRSLGKLHQLQAPTSGARRPSLNLEVSRRSYRTILDVNNLSFGFDERTLFSDVNFKIERGDKVGLVGKNGSGKTTLVKLLVGELEPVTGSVDVGRNVDIEYFDQELSVLHPDNTVIDTIWDVRPELEAHGLRSYLARFLFFGEEVFKEINMLSGGERKKLALARLLAQPANFLILDEPTNHLDIGSLEALLEALLEYDGALLFISHDRHLLNQVPRRILAIRGQRIIDHPGNYDSFAAHLQTVEPETAPEEAKVEKRQFYRRKKREQNIRSARKKRIKELEQLICRQEGEVDSLQRELLDERNAADWEKLQWLQNQKQEAQAKLDRLVSEFYQLIEEDEATDN